MIHRNKPLFRTAKKSSKSTTWQFLAFRQKSLQLHPPKFSKDLRKDDHLSSSYSSSPEFSLHGYLVLLRSMNTYYYSHCHILRLVLIHAWGIKYLVSSSPVKIVVENQPCVGITRRSMYSLPICSNPAYGARY